MTFFAYPFQIDATGRTATCQVGDFVRQAVEQVLFTIPGERANRPTFGSAAHTLVFEPASQEHATTVQYLIQAALQQWLGDVVNIEAIQIEASDAVLQITIQYQVRATQQREVARIARALAA
jgi:phage baseplate assembly protein W